MAVTLTHNHSGYDNFVLQTIIEDQYETKLDLMQFCTVDNSLVGVSGQKIVRHRYKATDGTEVLAMGQGNSKKIEVSMTEEEVEIKLYQNNFEWYDEEEMKDPYIVATGVNHCAVDMFNKTRADIFAEYNKATLSAQVDSYNFEAFVDAVSTMNLENAENTEIFGLLNPKMIGEVRKALKDDLKYVESFVRNGYIGTVAGVNLYTTKMVKEANGIVVATKEAVEYLNKVGSEVERTIKNSRSSDDANKRVNNLFTRKYGVPHFKDDRYAVKIIKKTVTPASNTAK